ncbi:hypothetical protein CJU70_04255 [Klebsiella pneumoniae]|nr:hypothetical protein CJU70_04255 [Klebsiella pneumoniae]OZR88783.1 hypothetical protein CIG38_08165 [Klebsiella pneumoniae]
MACGAVHRQTPEAGARCVNRARRDLCGGYPVTGIPTATRTYDNATKGSYWLASWVQNARQTE